MATVQDIFLQELLRVFNNTGGQNPNGSTGVQYGGTGQTGSVTGSPTGGSGTGSSYPSGGTGQTQGSGSNDPYAGITLVYNPITGRIDTLDPTLLQGVMTPDGTPILVVGEELVLDLRKKLTLEFGSYSVVENGVTTYYTADGSLSVTFEEPVIIAGQGSNNPLTLILEEPVIVGGPRLCGRI